jgi:ubiquinone biosynthesis protein UbiJ
MYAFLIRHLGLDASAYLTSDGRVDEAWARVVTPERLAVFTRDEPDDLRPSVPELMERLKRLQAP